MWAISIIECCDIMHILLISLLYIYWRRNGCLLTTQCTQITRNCDSIVRDCSEYSGGSILACQGVLTRNAFASLSHYLSILLCFCLCVGNSSIHTIFSTSLLYQIAGFHNGSKTDFCWTKLGGWESIYPLTSPIWTRPSKSQYNMSLLIWLK